MKLSLDSLSYLASPRPATSRSATGSRASTASTQQPVAGGDVARFPRESSAASRASTTPGVAGGPLGLDRARMPQDPSETPSRAGTASAGQSTAGSSKSSTNPNTPYGGLVTRPSESSTQGGTSELIKLLPNGLRP
ncbi:uncharacterized protein IL334_001104 [Kwoniella shivajii]|uniref:Uncharacterized protein n=1 Tax=Kwoniella shivajii TaxID=564305 RepID=A0ABZ1CSK6_9TREE|nr:hypothetical protein IL334_001104 [Kwoniella shivajii]